MQLGFDELLRYTNDERDKWRAWLSVHPEALEIEVQPDGRFRTIGALIDHIFLVERRHLQRLAGSKPDERTGLSGRHVPPLFDYGASVRRELEQFAGELDPDVASEPVPITVLGGATYPTSPRKLLFHCLLHEIRHWAQIALSLRRAGLEPPGNHDLFYSRAVK